MLLAAVKQFGIFTFFTTLSLSDLKWIDTLQVIARQQGRALSEDDVKKMTWNKKWDLLRSNLLTTARHFYHRLQCFFNTILLGPSQPLGKIIHYSYRIEFQQRGSPNAHIVIWVQGAPVPTDKDEDICAFKDRYVSCEIPDKDTDEHLHSLVTTVQRHSHTQTCRNKGTSCRFHYPKLPADKTLIAKPTDEEKEPVKVAEQNAKYIDILAKTHDTLSDQSATQKSFSGYTETGSDII